VTGLDAAEPIPLLRVVGGGTPTDEELAAVVAAVITLRRGDDVEAPDGSRWADRGRLLRRPVHPGPGAWRASAWRW